MPTGVEHGEVTFSTNHVESVDEGGWALPATVEDPPPATPVAAVAAPQRRGWMRRAAGVIASASEWVFGATALGSGLGGPGGDACGAVPQPGVSARSGRPGGAQRATPRRLGRRSPRGAGREHGPGRVALAAAGAPGRVAWRSSAELIDPGGPIARRWRLGLIVAIVLTVLHIAIACAGGALPRLPLAAGRSGLAGPEAAAGAALRRGARRGLGVRHGAPAAGLLPARVLRICRYAGLAAGTCHAPALGRKVPVLGLLGGLLLAIVALVLPFLQAHFAAEGRFAALFEYRAVRQRFRRRSLGVRADPVPDGTVRAAAVPAQDRDDPPRNGLAAEPRLSRLHLPGPGPDGLGLCPRARRRSSPATGSSGGPAGS